MNSLFKNIVAKEDIITGVRRTSGKYVALFLILFLICSIYIIFAIGHGIINLFQYIL